MFSIKKEIIENGNLVNIPNKYADYCMKKYLPDQVRVLKKENLKKAIEIALKPGSDVGQNKDILKLTEFRKISELNTSNLCCISHRWCSTSLNVNEFVEELLTLINYGIFSWDEMAKDKEFSESILCLYELVRKGVAYALDSFDEESKEEFYESLFQNLSLYGISEIAKTTKTSNEVDIPSRFYMERQMIAGKFYESMHPVDMSGDYVNDQITSLLMYEISKFDGQMPRLSQEDVEKTVFIFPKCKTFDSFSLNLKNLLSGLRQTMKSFPKNDIESKANSRLSEITSKLNSYPSFKLKTGFNGYDPISLAVLVMLTESNFSYFWIDVFCAPQGGGSTAMETLQSVKDGMAVFSLATVLILPPLDIEKWIEYKSTHVAELIDANHGFDDRRHYYPDLPFKSFDDRFFLFANDQYFLRMWTFHEMGIAPDSYYWWQYFFGPFKKFNKNKNEFEIHVEKLNAFKTGVVVAGNDFSISRKVNVQMLQEYGPGDAPLTWSIGTNFSSMQTTFSEDWNALARSLFCLDENISVSDALLMKKVQWYSSYLIQYSGPNRKHSYAWLENLRSICHTFKYDSSRKVLLSGCIENDSDGKETKFEVAKGIGKLGDKQVLSKCTVYKMTSSEITNFLNQCTSYTSILGLHCDEIIKACEENPDKPCYAILGKLNLSKDLENARKEAIENTKKSNPTNDPRLQDGINMLVKHLKDPQSVLFITSTLLSIAFGIVKEQEKEFLDRGLNLKKINSVSINLV